MNTVLSVVAGAIERDGRLLLCRRPMCKARGGQWECPGGKIEPGESPQQALSRELREELGVEIRAGERIACVDYSYPELSIRLALLSAVIERGEPKLLEHTQFRWVAPAEALKLDLCPADRILAEELLEKRHDV